MAPLRFLDDEGELVGDMMPHTEARTEQQLETETLRAVAEHDVHVAERGDDVNPPAEPDEPLHAGGDGSVGVSTGHWVVGVTAMEAALAAATVLSNAPESYSVAWMLLIAILFNTLLVASMAVPRAVNAWHIAWRPLAGATHDRRRIDAVRDFVGEGSYSHLSYSVRHGIHTLYEGIRQRRIQMPLPGARERMAQFRTSTTWELIRTGRAFVLTGAAAGMFSIISSPIGAAAKFAWGGAMTAKVRFFHHLSKLAAGLNLNAQSDREGHGGCFYPAVQEPVRRIMALKRRYPGVRIVLDLFDVPGAFSKVDMAADVVHQFAHGHAAQGRGPPPPRPRARSRSWWARRRRPGRVLSPDKLALRRGRCAAAASGASQGC